MTGNLFDLPAEPRAKRRLLRRLIDALRDEPDGKGQVRQDRDTARKTAELEQQLDKALQEDTM